MKVLVVNSNTEILPNPVVPLGALLAASAARDAGFETTFLDLAFAKDPEGAVREALARLRPDAAGISIRNVDNTDSNRPELYLPFIREAVVRPCLEALPGRVVLGGAGFSTMPEEILDFMGAPAGVVGDGEAAFPEILRRWAGGASLEGVGGAVLRGDGGSERVPCGAGPQDLDALPRAEPWRWLDLERYRAFGGWPNLQTKRGCPLRCAYCVYNRVEGSAYRFRSPDSVAAELAALAAHGARDAEFTDSTFNIPLDHAKKVLAAVAAGPRRLRLHTSGMNPLRADEELFDLMKRAGFASVGISAESASDRALEGLGKGYDAAAVRRILALTAGHDLDTFWYFLFGGPGETDETAEESLRFLDREVPPHHLVYIGAGIRIQKGAPVEAIARDQGVLGRDEGLLEPHFYFAPALDRERLLARIREEILAHPNYIQVQDYQGSRAPLVTARILKWLRYRRPTWTVVPMLNRFFARLGRKRR